MTKIDCFVNELELNLYLDLELPSRRKTALEEHLASCRSCSLRFAVARGLKNLLRESCKDAAAPPILKEQVISLIHEAPEARPRDFWGIAKSIFTGRPLLPIGIAVVVIAVFFSIVLLNPSSSGGMKLVTDLVHEHNEYNGGADLEHGIRSADPQEVRNWLAANSDMNINLSKCDKFPSLIGACETDERGRNVTCLFFDRGDERVSLFVYRSRFGDIPQAKLVKLKDRSIYCGSCTGNNYVLWSNDGLICILVGKLPEESLIEMAESLI